MRDKCRAKQDVSETLTTLLSRLSKNLSGDKLPAIIIGNIITSVLSKRPTCLLIALGLLVRDKKKVIYHTMKSKDLRHLPFYTVQRGRTVY